MVNECLVSHTVNECFMFDKKNRIATINTNDGVHVHNTDNSHN